MGANQPFIDSLNVFTLAYSWGGFESLAMPVSKGNNIDELKQRHDYFSRSAPLIHSLSTTLKYSIHV